MIQLFHFWAHQKQVRTAAKGLVQERFLTALFITKTIHMSINWRTDKQTSVPFIHWTHYMVRKQNKFWTDTTTRMNRTDNRSKKTQNPKKAKSKTAHLLWFHLHEVQEQAKLSYGIRGQNSGYPLGKGCWWEEDMREPSGGWKGSVSWSMLWLQQPWYI